MIGVYNHLLREVFGFHYHSQKVIGSLGYIFINQSMTYMSKTKDTYIYVRMDAYSKDMYKCIYTYANYGELRNNTLHQYVELVKTRGDSYSRSTT